MQTASLTVFSANNLPDTMLEPKLYKILETKLHAQSLQVIQYELDYLLDNQNAIVCVKISRERAIEVYKNFIANAKSGIYHKNKPKKQEGKWIPC